MFCLYCCGKFLAFLFLFRRHGAAAGRAVAVVVAAACGVDVVFKY